MALQGSLSADAETALQHLQRQHANRRLEDKQQPQTCSRWCHCCMEVMPQGAAQLLTRTTKLLAIWHGASLGVS